MQYACMGINITIRNVPSEVRDELAARAAQEGKSMQEFLRRELTRLASNPPVSAWLDAVSERKATYNTKVSASKILRARDADRK